MKRLLLAVLILAAGAPARAGNRGTHGTAPSSPAGFSTQAQPAALPALPASSIGAQTGFGASAVTGGVSLTGAAAAGRSASATTLAPNGAAASGAKGYVGIPAATAGDKKDGDEKQGEKKDAAEKSEEKAAGTTSADDEFGSSIKPEQGEEKAGQTPLSAEGDKSKNDVKFDGSAETKKDVPVVEAPKTFTGKIFAKLGLSEPGKKKESLKTPFDRDDYGGPQTVKLTGGQKVKEGVKWGFTLMGIATLIQVTLGLIFSKFPWQLYVSKGFLQGTGRVELMTGMGPTSIVEAIIANPIAFFTIQMPLMTAWEEFVYRGLQFAFYFFLFAAAKPAAEMFKRFLEKVPDLFSLRTVTLKALNLVSKLSGRAFGLAAVITAWHFATAHFAAWGFDPVTIAVHGTLGFALSYLAYKTRSLATAFVAHFTYNALSVLGVVVALMFGPLAAMIYALGIGVTSVVAAFMHWRSYRKAKQLAISQARLTAAGVVASLVIGLMMTGIVPKSGTQQAAEAALTPKSTTGWIVPAQQAAPNQKNGPQQQIPDVKPGETAPDSMQAPQDSLPPEVREAILNFQKALGIQSLEPQKQLAPLAALTAKAKNSTVMVENPGKGLGSGFVISKDGLLFTNAHVVDDSKVVVVKFENGMTGMARVVAVNHDKDIALVQLPKHPEGKDWEAIELAAEAPSEGEEVIALGHPRGLPFTVTRGIVSGVGARGNLYVEHVQTDAAINPGNSGGPLVDANTGKVVGMNTQIITQAGGSEGLGFAITAASLQAALDQYRATGNINSSYFGIIVNMGGENDKLPGVLVELVRPGTPAAAAGLKPGDVILGANDVTFSDPEQSLLQLATIIAKTKPGKPLILAVARDGDIAVRTIVLADKK
jgi:S1-C subfamily serine protease/membrane protease YdiL (CAAX protease family)